MAGRKSRGLPVPVIVIIGFLGMFSLVVLNLLDKKRDLPFLWRPELWWLQLLEVFAFVIFGFMFWVGAVIIMGRIYRPYFSFSSGTQKEEEEEGENDE